MRKFLIMSLLASAALSAQASADDQQRRPRGGGGMSEASNDDGQSRPSRPSFGRGDSGSSDDGARASRAESRRARPEPAPSADIGASAQTTQQQQASGRRHGGGGGGAPQLPSGDNGGQQSTQAAPAQSGSGASPFQQRLRDRRAAQGSAATQTTARAPGIAGGPRRGPFSGRVATAPAGGRIQVASKPDKGWYDQYRAERLRTLEQHRARNRDHYHLGNYWDPYGYNYRSWQVGWMMWPSYYQQDYWLNDPYSWRLPTVYGPYRWVRYWDDALLVNVYTGQVVDVLRNVFW